MIEHSTQAVSFIETCRWIKQNLPNTKVSGGVSNLSFSFREIMLSGRQSIPFFLYHAINAGMDMGM